MWLEKIEHAHWDSFWGLFMIYSKDCSLCWWKEHLLSSCWLECTVHIYYTHLVWGAVKLLAFSFFINFKKDKKDKKEWVLLCHFYSYLDILCSNIFSSLSILPHTFFWGSPSSLFSYYIFAWTFPRELRKHLFTQDRAPTTDQSNESS